jgi:hypothetical protein
MVEAVTDLCKRIPEDKINDLMGIAAVFGRWTEVKLGAGFIRHHRQHLGSFFFYSRVQSQAKISIYHFY